MNATDLHEDTERIEREIVRTRASLHRKLDELQHRLNPRERVRSVAHAVDPRHYARPYAERLRAAARGLDSRASVSLLAVAAVIVGSALAVRGLRARRGGMDDPIVTEMMGE